MQLYQHQRNTKADIEAAHKRGVNNVLTVMPTGSGKTAVFTNLMGDYNCAMATAHRRELVAQIALAMAKWKMPHRIIAPKQVVSVCIKRQVRELGRHYYDPRAPYAAVAVDTLIQPKREFEQSAFLKNVEMNVQDEAHHVQMDPLNKWGRGVNLTPQAKIAGFTATALRADGRGLGLNNNGVFQVLVQGIGMRTLIKGSYLKKYRVFNAQKREIKIDEKDISTTTGDYKKSANSRIVKENNIIGDVVAEYKRLAMGRRGITFAPSVEIAQEIAHKFNQAGVPAMCLSEKTSDDARESALLKIERKELLQLVNVDLFGEGFDLPAIECVSFARKTVSYGLYVQQFGRALRPTPGCDTALIMDFVGNVMYHGLPDGEVIYDLEPSERHRRPKGALLARTCAECSQTYERELLACPECDWVPTISNRSAPEFVEGDLFELDEETLNRLRQDAVKAIQPIEQYEEFLKASWCPQAGLRRNLRNHQDKIVYQSRLRDAIAVWCGFHRDSKVNDSIVMKRFYTAFGIDLLTAQALNAQDACKLELKILGDMKNVII